MVLRCIRLTHALYGRHVTAAMSRRMNKPIDTVDCGKRQPFALDEVSNSYFTGSSLAGFEAGRCIAVTDRARPSAFDGNRI